MKTKTKILRLTSVLFIVTVLNCSAQTYSSTTIYTPAGSQLTAYVLTGGDMSSYWKNYWKEYWLDYYEDRIVYESEATYKYNCHGFAWWITEGGSDVWIGLYDEDDEDVFWEDHSYLEVPYQSWAKKVSFGDADNHSAITTGTNNWFTSKWGASPLFSHSNDDCPYDNSDLHYYVRPYISGSGLLCSSGSEYSIQDLPGGASISWSCSSNITRVSSQGSNPCEFQANSNGATGWIDATVTYNYVQCNLTEKTVWVGVPALTYVTGPTEGYVYNPYTFYASPQRDPISQSEYEWVLNPLLDNEVYPYYDYADIYFYDAYSGYQVVARAYNTCGYTDWELTNIDISSGEKMYMLSPNPASEEFTITLKSPINSNLKESNSDNSNITYSIRILDMNGYAHFTGIRSGVTFTIPVNNLKDGNYFVQVIDGKKITTLKLIIKH